MTTVKQESPRFNNYILDTLPEADYQQFYRELQLVELKQGDVLFQAHAPIELIYFPTTALLSWVALTENGEMVEAGIVGYEGVAGISVVMGDNLSPYQIEVELPGFAYKMRAATFIEMFEQSRALNKLILRYAHTQLVQLAQSTVCNRFHTVEARLCRWLLGASDRVKSEELALTQEILSHMIGARRPAVSIVTGTLQNAGLIRARRGKITIVNHEKLEEASCECYRIVRDEFARFTGGK
jgi:CRP-like cAMP-binding protein